MKNQKGIIQFGIIGLLVLTAGLFAVTKLASNPDLTFFNIAEKAAGKKCDEYGEGECGSKCSPAGYTCQWKKGECKTSSKKCGASSETSGTKKDEKKDENGGESCGDGGTCRNLNNCYDEPGLKNISGSCNKGKCCIGTGVSSGGGGGGGGGGGNDPVCGNGTVEEGEECDEQSDKCSNCKTVTPPKKDCSAYNLTNGQTGSVSCHAKKCDGSLKDGTIKAKCVDGHLDSTGYSCSVKDDTCPSSYQTSEHSSTAVTTGSTTGSTVCEEKKSYRCASSTRSVEDYLSSSCEPSTSYTNCIFGCNKNSGKCNLTGQGEPGSTCFLSIQCKSGVCTPDPNATGFLSSKTCE